jgi:predicted DsbA family dithiol-disulfide isomerase
VIRIPVSITSDFICPWCYIGERRLAHAATEFAQQTDDAVELEITWRPFELNPGMPPEGIDRRAYRVAKFGSWEHSQRLDAQVIEAGKPDGVVFNYDRITRTPNTRRAHRLVWWASRNGHKPDVLVEALFQAYFVEGRDLAVPDVLVHIVTEAGLNGPAAAAFLETDQGTEEIVAAELESQRRGVHGVPDFRVGPIAFSGAQTIEIMTEALRRAARAQ